ncbi:hypothetical protein ACFFIX_06480 [Metabacillus herbersteinensis]|uniref:Regulatory protein FmdB Zinc ribbon domain-containing protein n=1 Tax=Metabacillus herbersteinensis TaxID=283816 RepID=A0ABV6GBP3_9BACI
MESHLFHVYECESCILTFAVEQAFEDHAEVVCPICKSDESLKDVASGAMKLEQNKKPTRRGEL